MVIISVFQTEETSSILVTRSPKNKANPSLVFSNQEKRAELGANGILALTIICIGIIICSRIRNWKVPLAFTIFANQSQGRGKMRFVRGFMIVLCLILTACSPKIAIYDWEGHAAPERMNFARFSDPSVGITVYWYKADNNQQQVMIDNPQHRSFKVWKVEDSSSGDSFSPDELLYQGKDPLKEFSTSGHLRIDLVVEDGTVIDSLMTSS